MSDNVRVNNYGIGFPGLLTIVFITLKLTGYINWSWWWVLSPLWITALLSISIFLIILLVVYLSEKRRR